MNRFDIATGKEPELKPEKDKPQKLGTYPKSHPIPQNSYGMRYGPMSLLINGNEISFNADTINVETFHDGMIPRHQITLSFQLTTAQAEFFVKSLT